MAQRRSSPLFPRLPIDPADEHRPDAPTLRPRDLDLAPLPHELDAQQLPRRRREPPRPADPGRLGAQDRLHHAVQGVADRRGRPRRGRLARGRDARVQRELLRPRGDGAARPVVELEAELARAAGQVSGDCEGRERGGLGLVRGLEDAAGADVALDCARLGGELGDGGGVDG